jgi:3-oxoacyl-[acyl-carrier protein] reductase
MKTALITGASGGIGRATAKLFAKNGVNVILNYFKNSASALSLEREINAAAGGRALAVGADVRSEADVRRMFGRAAGAFLQVDVLVNNAGAAWQGLLTDMSLSQWDDLFATNVRGAFLCSREALPAMVSAKKGSIINVSSIWGIAGASCEVCYSAAKAALIGFTKALAREAGPSGVRVNCVAPGLVDTDMNACLSQQDIDGFNSGCPLGRGGSPEDIARAVYYLASDGAGFITGQVLSPNGVR